MNRSIRVRSSRARVGRRGRSERIAGGSGAAPLRPRPGEWISPLLRCRKDAFYIARAVREPAVDRSVPPCPIALTAAFFADGRPAGTQALWLRQTRATGERECVGWLQTPRSATHVCFRAPLELAAGLGPMQLFPLVERDPKCHPLAATPRWSAYQPPFPLERVVLPESLADLGRLFPGQRLEVLPAPRTRAALFRATRAAAAVLDPRWAIDLRLGYRDLESLADGAWLIVDLDTLATALAAAGLAQTEAVVYESPHGLLSARVEYADVATRGFALQDVFPLCVVEPGGAFSMRVMRSTSSWKRFSGQAGFAPLLSSETPWERRNADVLSAAAPAGRGELIATDLPWIVSGALGAPLAPRLAEHALCMHLGAPLEDYVQHWNRWDEADILVRDIADFARRYSPLRPLRWAGADGCVELGLLLESAPGRSDQRPLMIRTGRIDPASVHDGVPPEPMLVFMKWLAREAREQTAWSRDVLRGRPVLWQFSSAAGQKYAALYESAGNVRLRAPVQLEIRMDSGAPAMGDTTYMPGERAATSHVAVIGMPDEGVFGDSSLAFSRLLWRHISDAIVNDPDCR